MNSASLHAPRQVVKVYISIYSDDFGKKRAMSNLKRLEPYVRKEMGQRVPLRLTPEYRFEYDDTLDEMELVGSWREVGGAGKGCGGRVVCVSIVSMQEALAGACRGKRMGRRGNGDSCPGIRQMMRQASIVHRLHHCSTHSWCCVLVPLPAMPSQVQKVIGEKDLARYKRELAEEYGEDEVEDEEEEGKGDAGQRGQATGWQGTELVTAGLCRKSSKLCRRWCRC